MTCVVVDHSCLWSYKLSPSSSRFDLTGLSKGTFVIEKYRFTLCDISALVSLVASKNLSIVVKIPNVGPKEQHTFAMATYLAFSLDDTRMRVFLYIGGEMENSEGKLVNFGTIPWYLNYYPELKGAYLFGPASSFEGKSYQSVSDLELAIDTPAPPREIQKRCAITPPPMRVVQKVASSAEKFLESLTFDLDVGVFDASELAMVYIPLEEPSTLKKETTNFRVVAFSDNHAVAFVNRSKVITFERATPANAAAFVAFLQATKSHPLDFTLGPIDQEDTELLVSSLVTGIPIKPFKHKVPEEPSTGPKIEEVVCETPDQDDLENIPLRKSR